MEFNRKIPVWKDGYWVDPVEYDDPKYLHDELAEIFMEPGQYGFTEEVSEAFNQQARDFRSNNNVYCMAAYLTSDFITYWDGEKAKCINGAFFYQGNNKWYLPRDYYMWLNFLPIFDKIKGRFDFPLVWDVQYHMSLYEDLALLIGKNAVVVKKRQIASSFFHCAKIINRLWFDEGAKLKLAASLSSYIEDDWNFLESYRDFLNENTAWYRPMSPNTRLNWMQQIEIRDPHTKRSTKIGNKSNIKGISLENNPTKGVGGPCHRLGTKIMMSNGRLKNVEDIKIGEYVMGIDHKPKKVKRIFSGIDDMYHVLPRRGEDFFVTGNHILSLFTTDSNVKKTKERLVKVKDWQNLTNYQKERYVLKRNDEPIEFNNNTDCTLDPYFLGLWLGDGYREKVGIIINYTRDKEIFDYCVELGKKVDVDFKYVRKERERYNDVMISGHYPTSIDFEDTCFTKDFVKYNLFYNKHIPDEYLYGSIEVRKQLLAGIVDTDGHFATNKYRYEISQKNKTLFDQIVFLARSLGAIVHTRKTSSQEHIVNGRTIKYTETNVCTISFKENDFLPVKTKRKQDSRGKIKSICYSSIKDVEYIGKEQYAGIEVEDEHYYINDSLISHNCSLMFVDEAGLLANLYKTYEFVRPSMYMGSVKTGQFIAAGSVGELDDAEPIKNMLLHPQGVDAYIVQSDLIDENRTTGETALFIPEQWGMPPFIDKAGNSLVQEALAELNKEFEQYRQTLSPEEYQLRISQHPRNIKECFAVRELSIFPTNIIQDQMLRIQDKQYPYELIELDEDVVRNEIIVRHTNRHPINEWPVKKTSLDKRGAIQVWERPDKNAPNGTYIASIDPVNVGKTTTSDSLCSIYVYKMPVEVTKVKEEGNETFVEGDKIVCAWCGRYDDIDETNRQLRLILEWYKCEALVENNVPTFITYMQHEKKQQYLTTSDKMLFLKEYVGKNGYQTYGWRNTNTLFKNNILPYLIEYLCDVLDEERDENGVLIRKIFGATRIPDNMAFVEMLGYNENVNCDRLIALASLIAYSRIKLANEKRKVRVDYENKNLAVSKNLYKFTSTAFRNIGRNKYSGMSISRSPFKHLR